MSCLTSIQNQNSACTTEWDKNQQQLVTLMQKFSNRIWEDNETIFDVEGLMTERGLYLDRCIVRPIAETLLGYQPKMSWPAGYEWTEEMLVQLIDTLAALLDLDNAELMKLVGETRQNQETLKKFVIDIWNKPRPDEERTVPPRS